MNRQPETKASGDLDPTFGDGGVLVLPEGFSSRVAQLSDGKLLVTGQLDNDIALLRLQADGTPDTTFGEAGVKRLYTLQPSESSIERIAVFPDDSLVLQGKSGELDTYLLRTRPTGELDSTFGNAGHALLALQGGPNSITTVAAQPDGKVLLIVRVHPTLDIFDTWLVRLANGRLDPSFGDQGSGMTLIGRLHTILDLEVLADGRLFMAGSFGQALLVQCQNDGQLDTAFGEQGYVLHTVEQGRGSHISAISQQVDGKIAAVGTTHVLDTGTHCLTTRILADGTLDPTFNLGVPWLDNYTGVGAQNLAVIQQRDGKLVTGGTLLGTSETSKLILMRFNPTTDLDETFGDKGRVTTQLGGFDVVVQVFQQHDDKILAAGSSLGASPFAVIARYLS
ncbi:hypothetical protein [Pseudomonas japonica]|uniref:Delta-60 repeat domain-containing protein n=1 Tax=Pseudomonas japonica TaxID=256466 RepID=A0A239K0E7_9PSED|nr:hypothetical protein [Pseudomonas japonica]SNT11475.1 delta-60 repeat domain-containing protein [Pseudomonas japonica]